MKQMGWENRVQRRNANQEAGQNVAKHFLDTGSNQVSEGSQTGVEVFVLKWLYPLDDFNDKLKKIATTTTKPSIKLAQIISCFSLVEMNLIQWVQLLFSSMSFMSFGK